MGSASETAAAGLPTAGGLTAMLVRPLSGPQGRPPLSRSCPIAYLTQILIISIQVTFKVAGIDVTAKGKWLIEEEKRPGWDS